MHRAVFLDRDGTIIEQVHHLIDPAEVKLIRGAAEAIYKLRAYGFRCVVVTNQSVIGRGMLSVEGLGKVHLELIRQLASHNTKLDGIYYCPVVPQLKDVRIVENPDRKPGPGMLSRAATDLKLDLRQSWMVGDTISDMLAGRNAGCRCTVLVRTGYGQEVDPKDQAIDYVMDNLRDVAELIISNL